MNTNTQRPTPETDAAFRDGYTFCVEDMRPAVEFCANLERERDEARESKDRISKRAEAIRCELVEKGKQLAATQLYLDEARKELEAMREAIKEAHTALKAECEAYCHTPPQFLKASLAKLQPFLP